MLLQFRNWLVNSEHVTEVHLIGKTRFGDSDSFEPSVYLMVLQSQGPAFPLGSTEADAVVWWFTEADRAKYLPGRFSFDVATITVDVVGEYVRHAIGPSDPSLNAPAEGE